MNIHISGISGFVGTNLSRFLQANNYSVKPISLRDQNFDKSSFFDSDVIIHLAGKAHDLKNSSNSDEYYKVNTDLTIRLFDFFLSSKASLFIFMSSVKAVVDDIDKILDENIQPSPTTHYGKSKLLAEEYILKSIIPAHKKLIILRPCMIHGPGNKGNLNLLFKIAVSGFPYPLASFNNQRSFLSIDNLCFVIKEMIDRSDIPSGIYNVADDAPISTNRVMEIMSETISKRPRLWKINKSFIKYIAKAGDFLALPLNSERLQKLTESYVVSNAKLLAAIKKKLPVSSEEGLRKTIQSFAGLE